jgi:hypothetical protein
LFIWQATGEDSLQSLAECVNARVASAARGVVLAMTLVGVGCSSSSTPPTPDPSGDGFIGIWSGTVRSSVIGAGTATIVFDSGLKSPMLVQVTGQWTFVFPDSRFNASGTATGTQLRNDPLFVVLFSRSLVPCPDAPGGTDERGRSASLIVSGNRMSGGYMDNGCPGGSLDLVRK